MKQEVKGNVVAQSRRLSAAVCVLLVRIYINLFHSSKLENNSRRLLQRLETLLLINRLGGRFAMTNSRHCEEKGANDYSISKRSQ